MYNLLPKLLLLLLLLNLTNTRIEILKTTLITRDGSEKYTGVFYLYVIA